MDLLLADLQHRMEDKQLHLTMTDAAKAFVVAHGYDPVYGARPLKRFLQHSVETMLARIIIKEDPAPGTTLEVDVENDDLTVHLQKPAA